MPAETRIPTVENYLKALDYSVLQQCIHCGMCLPTCPTYVETGHERNSPRGRIALMRAVADDELEVTKAFGEELYYCLGCLACMSACPAGVDYAGMFEMGRAQAEKEGVLRSPVRNGVRAFTIKFLFMRPRLLRAAGRLLYWYQASGLQSLVRKSGILRLLPRRLRELEPLTPSIERRFSDSLIREHEAPENPRYRVGLLTGCVQDLAFPSVNRDTADVLLAAGCEVVTPRCQYCCGSLHGHNGEWETAAGLARRNLDAFDLDSLDAVITNAAGCGSHLKHYDRLLAGDPDYADRAARWSAKVKDISEWLVEIGAAPPGLPEPVAATYHEACHLCHGQGISRQPRELLAGVSGLELTELEEATWCCGSAGVYNITQPATAGRLLDRKIKHIRATGAETVLAANPGCIVQLQAGVRKHRLTCQVRHPVSLLADAWRSGG